MLNPAWFPDLHLIISVRMQYDGPAWETSAIACPLQQTFTASQLQLIMPKLATIHHKT